MMLLQGDPVQSWHLLNEALVERSYFIQAAPYLNKELKLLIPSSSLLATMFWYLPGAFGYHLMYMKSGFKHNFNDTLKGPSMISKKSVKKQYPEAK
jgi:glycerol-3-phosphate dehydrogenase